MIRTYRESDLNQIINVWREAAEVAYTFLPGGQLDQEQVDIRTKYLPVAETWVCEQDGQVAGFISLFGNFIGGLFVAPAFQHRGIGTCLIEHAQTIHRSLFLDVFRENARAIRFYRHCGFEITREGFDEQTGLAELTMTLSQRREL